MKGFWNWYYHFRCVLPGMPKLMELLPKLAILQHLKKEMSDEAGFLNTDKH